MVCAGTALLLSSREVKELDLSESKTDAMSREKPPKRT
jgi:hypothetical protein